MLTHFLYRHLRGYRFLVVIAILMTIFQVGSDIVAAMPLKFIPSKINNAGSDPACTFPFLDGILSIFDIPMLDGSLAPAPGSNQIKSPPTSPCPQAATNTQPTLLFIKLPPGPKSTSHSVIGVIVFSVLLLLIFSIISAILTYIARFLASYIAQNLSARLRN